MRKNKRTGRLAPILLSCLLMAAIPASAWGAEDSFDAALEKQQTETETAAEQIEEETGPEEVSGDRDSGDMPAGGTDEDSLNREQNLTEASEETDPGTEEAGSEAEERINADSESAAEADAPVLEITDPSQTETAFTVRMTCTMPSDSEKLTAAVWSIESGQDDLRWYDLSEKDGAYAATVKTSLHKSSGSYNVHVYLQKKNGTMVFLEKGSFSVSPVTAGSIETEQETEHSSSARVLIRDVQCPSGVKSILVPVWSRSDQSDIHWYTAVKTGEDQWTARLEYANHSSASGGSFHVHVYGVSGAGAQNYIGSTAVILSPAKPELRAVPGTSGLKTVLSNCSVKKPKAVSFAVWSDKNGQDDLKWYTASSVSGGKASVTIPHPAKPGLYHIHCYAKNSSGKQVFQTSIDYTAEIPAADSVTAAVSETEEGSFTLTVSGISASEQVREILIPVWSASDQSDIFWYTAVRQADGTWTAEGDTSRHKNHSGIYQAHVYIRGYTGKQRYCCRTEFRITAVTAQVSAELSRDGSLQLKAERVPGRNIKEVRFAVWSADKGQDDLRWYRAARTSSVYTAEASIRNHGGKGPVYIHAYAVTTDGKMLFLQSTQAEADLSLQAGIRTGEFSDESFSADLFLDTDSFMTIEKVEMAVWSASDQSDIHWYTAAVSADNRWYAEFSPALHKGHSGTYQIHAYVTFVNQVRIFAASSTCTVNPGGKQFIRENRDGTVTAVLYEKKRKAALSAAVWSTEGGQDDLKWYPLTWNGTCYSAVLSAGNHRHSGSYLIHYYAGSQFLGAGSFSFPEYLSATESISRTPGAARSDVKFFRGKLAGSYNGSTLVLRNTDGSIFRHYPDVKMFWFNVLEEESLIIYTNGQNQLGLVKLGDDYSVLWNRTITAADRRIIDPSVVKTDAGYLATATRITGAVNNSDPNTANGEYTVCSWFSSDLVNWSETDSIITDQYNLEDVDLLEKDGVLYLVYEKEQLDKGLSSIVVQTSSDGGVTWSSPKELLPADCDHEPAGFLSSGDRFILYYSSDKGKVGSSYMGAKAYYALYDSELNCISRDTEIKTSAKGGILWYDITWIDSAHCILYSEDYLTQGTLVVERSR